MMNKLRGRSLAHPGCLIGITAGLIVGIVLAGLLAMANVSYLAVVLIWLGLTVGLGAAGWFVGLALTPRFPALEEEHTGTDPNTPAG